jgi:PAS domain S-box-containing protein
MKDKKRTKEQLVSELHELYQRNAELESNLTTYKLIEGTLKENAEIFHLLSEQSLIGIAILQDHQFKYLNQATSDIIGYSVDEMMNWQPKEYLNIIHPNDRSLIIKKRTGKKNDVRNYICRVTSKQGKIKTTEISSKFIVFKNRPANFVTVLDITEKQEAQKKQRETVEFIDKIVESSIDGIAICDAKGNIISVNKALTNICKFNKAELIGEHISILKPKDKSIKTDFLKKTKKLFAKGFASYESIHEAKDGSYINVECNSSMIKNDEGDYIAGITIIRDITKRKKVEKALIKREQELELKTHNLEQSNITLQVLLDKRAQDKTDLEDKVLANIKELVFPFLEKLKQTRLSDKQTSYMKMIESSLKNVISPFLERLSTQYYNFTPNEIKVANLIREGLTTKEIASLLNSSTYAINFHRHNIRQKLGLKHQKKNLQSYLTTLS